ncbi:MAG: hypothetical protein OXT65_01425 [Alphaproteobacteria bacterium]|nr:hypothetical protein [Alphaproteobacteria bacterium]
MTSPAPDLRDLLKPGETLPPAQAMIDKALEILAHSQTGHQLVEFADMEKIDIRIIATPKPTTYLPESRAACIGFNKSDPVSPSRFVLMLAGILREAQQEISGVSHPDLDEPEEKHIEIGLAKQEDKVWHLCSVAFELSDQPKFTEYNFLDELGKMGHHESIELFRKQERSG